MAPDRRPESLERRAGLDHELTTGFGVGTGGTPVPAPGVVPGEPRRERRWRAPALRPTLGSTTLVAVGLVVGFAIARGWAGPVVREVSWFLDFYCGVFALVSLSLAVMVGLLATDRALLRPRHRVHAQAAHRAFAFIAVGMLVVHLGTQLARERVGLLQALVPMDDVHLMDYGLGTAALYLMVIAVGTGIVRGRFALTGRPWLWRILHLTAYLAWPLGIVHGLTSGRHPAPWVTAGYALCVTGVLLALTARPFLARRARRRP